MALVKNVKHIGLTQLLLEEGLVQCQGSPRDVWPLVVVVHGPHEGPGQGEDALDEPPLAPVGHDELGPPVHLLPRAGLAEVVGVGVVLSELHLPQGVPLTDAVQVLAGRGTADHVLGTHADVAQNPLQDLIWEVLDSHRTLHRLSTLGSR